MPLLAVPLPEQVGTVIPAQAPSNPALGRAIRRLRLRHSLTIETLALDAGVHPTYLSGIERGIRNPTWSKLCALADTLSVPVTTIVKEAENDICPVCGSIPLAARSTGGCATPCTIRVCV
jgi:DNA-binding XRE family transcriptional regulator